MNCDAVEPSQNVAKTTSTSGHRLKLFNVSKALGVLVWRCASRVLAAKVAQCHDFPLSRGKRELQYLHDSVG
jgi:hypothetical protein